MPRRGNIRTLERKLGFYSERGLSRSGGTALTPEVTHMLEVIDEIKKDYVGLSEHELLSSDSFEKAWRDLFWELGPQLWPELPSDSRATKDPEFYSRPLVFLERSDRPILEQGFSQLVLQKCLTYQQNQAAKRQRDSKAAEARHRKDGDYVPGIEYDDPAPRASFRFPSEQSATSSVSSGDSIDELYESDTMNTNGNTNKSAKDVMLESVMAQSDDQSIPPHSKPIRLPWYTMEPRNHAKRHRQEDDDDDGRPMKRPYHDNNASPFETEQTDTPDATLANGFRPINKEAEAPILKALKASRPPGTTACEPCSRRKVRCDGTRSKCHFRAGRNAEGDPDKTSSIESIAGRKKLVIKLAVPRPGSSNHTPSVAAEDAMTDVSGPDIRSIQTAASSNDPAVQPSAASVEPASRANVTGVDDSEMNEDIQVSAQKDGGSPSKAIHSADKRNMPDEQLRQPLMEPPVIDRNGLVDRSDPERLPTQQLNPASMLHQTSTPKTIRMSSPSSTSSIAGQGEYTVGAQTAAPGGSSRLSDEDSRPIENGDKIHEAMNGPTQNTAHSIAAAERTHQEMLQLLENDVAASCRARGARQGNKPDIGSAKRTGEGSNGSSAPSPHLDRPEATDSTSHPRAPDHEGPEPAQPSASTPVVRLATGSNSVNAIQAQPCSSTDMPRSTGAVELPRQDRPATEISAPPSDDPALATTNRTPNVLEQTLGASLPPDTPTIDTPAAIHTPIDAKGPFASAEARPVKTELMSGIWTSSTTPSALEDSKPAVATPTPSAGTGMIILVDWIHKDGTSDTVSRLTRYKRNLWDAVKVDMPTSFQSKKLAGIKPGMVKMSAADALEQYGESIASEGLEDCVQFLMDEAFGDEGEVERTWRKATVMMRD